MREIETNSIINAYKATFNSDVKRFFKNIDRVQLYECLDTGYKFYSPFNISGDSDFYAHFQQYDWYYMDWKWEHQTARDLIAAGDKVLEIGCGKGSFVEHLTKDNINCTGLELNQAMVRECQSRGLNVCGETVWQHLEFHSAKYDVVCLFQVLEHIADCRRLLDASLAALKHHGKLIISVPNDDSFLGLDKNNILNWPPHHMGLWSEKTIKKLPEFFRLKLKRMCIEPLQPYHQKYFIDVVSKNKRAYKKWGWLIDFLSDSMLSTIVNRWPHKIKGFTVLAEYSKI